ncbi:MAG: GNAT family N-acetyltransferase [Gammaproteobacteria bacterium]|nr:MAG: GNAT family N-acetyltransferase [Gammaproteobacteria bacterium]
MEGTLSLSETPPPWWEARCEERGLLLHSERWQAVLTAGLGCRPLYAVGDAGAAVFNLFRKGPFRIAYLAHPVGGLLEGGEPGQLLTSFMAQARPAPHLLRIPCSAFGDDWTLDWEAAETPETAICDLQAWSEERLPSGLRRNIRLSARRGCRVERLSSGHGGLVYALYRASIGRHGGSLRYPPAYFSALLELAGRERRLRCLGAWVGGELAAFIVVAGHGDTCFYLHGGMLIEHAASQGPTRLFAEAIRWAREEGHATFNFMSSPPDQPSLVRYKERWGGVTRSHRTHELARSRFWKQGLRVSQALYDRFRSG